jgi:ATP-dependent Clp protease ATP-binding subunit ClpX
VSNEFHDEHGVSCTCSFCGKSQQEVGKLIAGPSVFICDECIELCNEMVLESPQAENAPFQFEKQLLKPKEINAYLDEYVIGQDHAKRILSVAVHNH